MSAARLACKRGAAAVPGLNPRRVALNHSCRHVTMTSGRALLVDTLASVRKLEGQGIPSKQAEAITEVLIDGLENVVSKSEMQKCQMLQDSSYGKFKSEVKISQEHHFSLLQRESEKLKGDFDKLNEKLKGDIDKINERVKSDIDKINERVKGDVDKINEKVMGDIHIIIEKVKGDTDKIRSELRYELDKLSAGQRLDLNLEKGRMRDELAKQNAENNDFNTKLDRDIHALRAQLEAAKYDVIKYCVATLVSISAVGLATIRILM